jgi:hypothetical protein
MPWRRTAELVQEVATIARDTHELFDEYETAVKQRGGGVSRDPASVLLELREELRDLLAAAREARDELEREAGVARP